MEILLRLHSLNSQVLYEDQGDHGFSSFAHFLKILISTLPISTGKPRNNSENVHVGEHSASLLLSLPWLEDRVASSNYYVAIRNYRISQQISRLKPQTYLNTSL